MIIMFGKASLSPFVGELRCGNVGNVNVVSFRTLRLISVEFTNIFPPDGDGVSYLSNEADSSR